MNKRITNNEYQQDIFKNFASLEFRPPFYLTISYLLFASILSVVAKIDKMDQTLIKVMLFYVIR